MGLTKDKRVIHLGCADHIELIDEKMRAGTHLQSLLQDNCLACIGIDLNGDAIEYLKEEYGMRDVFCADVLSSSFKGRKEVFAHRWDYLLLGEILEHTDNPVAFLRDIAAVFRGVADSIIITVPNAYSSFHCRYYKKHRTEMINSDHRYWFSPYTLAKVMCASGMDLTNVFACDMPDLPVWARVVNKVLKLATRSSRPLFKDKAHLSTTLIAIGRIG